MPLRLRIHQDAITFGLSFFNYRPPAGSVPTTPAAATDAARPAFFQQVTVSRIRLRIDYTPTVTGCRPLTFLRVPCVLMYRCVLMYFAVCGGCRAGHRLREPAAWADARDHQPDAAGGRRGQPGTCAGTSWRMHRRRGGEEDCNADGLVSVGPCVDQRRDVDGLAAAAVGDLPAGRQQRRAWHRLRRTGPGLVRQLCGRRAGPLCPARPQLPERRRVRF